MVNEQAISAANDRPPALCCLKLSPRFLVRPRARGHDLLSRKRGIMTRTPVATAAQVADGLVSRSSE
jgi:hypothetical protein